MHFEKKIVRSSGENQENPACMIEKKNQRYLNIRYLRQGSRLNFFRDLVGYKKEYTFNFTYDKTNSQLWYARFQASATSGGDITYYFPATTGQDSLTSEQAFKKLLKDLEPAESWIGYYSLIKHLFPHMFMPNGTTNLPELEQLHQYAQQSIYYPGKNLQHFFLDMLATKVSLAESASIEPKSMLPRFFLKNSNNNESILPLMQIIYAPKDSPDRLQDAIKQDGALVDNKFNLDKIKTFLDIQSAGAGIVSTVLSPELQNILKEYADKRIHSEALAHQWYNVAKKEYEDNLHNAYFFNRLFLALAIINTFFMVATFCVLVATACPCYLLPLSIFAFGAIFFGFKSQEEQTPVECARARYYEIEAAEASFNMSCRITEEEESLSSNCIQQACAAFEQQLTTFTMPTL